MSNLVTVLGDQGKYEEAEEIYQYALGLKEMVLGKEHPDTLTSMSNPGFRAEESGQVQAGGRDASKSTRAAGDGAG